MRRRWVVLVAVAVVAGWLLIVQPWDGDDPRAGSEDLGRGEHVAITGVPDTYRITYRVEDDAVGTVGSERITVDRPFRSRLETYDTAEPGGEPESVEIADLGRTSRQTSSSGRLAVAIGPTIGLADLRLDAVLDDALERGLLEPREARRVLDRVCQVYRTGQSVRAGELQPPTDDRFVDVCVDEAGLLLEEVEADRRRIAIDVEIDPEVDDETFDVGARSIPINQGGGVVRELTAESRPPALFWELGDDLPLPVLGRYAVVPPQPEAFTDPLRRGRRLAGVADVLADEGDMIVVERAGTLEGIDVIGDASANAVDVELGALGTGSLLLTVGGPELTVELDGGRYVRLTGTVAAGVLVGVARALQEVDGGELIPIGETW